jgi:multiple sugar transport system substrate-binding protein
MNRLVVVIVAIAVLAVGIWAIASAGDDDGTENASAGANGGGGSVRLWVMNNGPDPVNDTEKIVAPFEKESGIDVKVQLVGWDVQFDRIRNAAVSGEGPDVTRPGRRRCRSSRRSAGSRT